MTAIVRGDARGSRLLGARLIAACLVVLASASPALAQNVPAPAGDTLRQVPPALDISPGGAFWRALIFPGWGHAAIDAHARGGFYFAAQSATIYNTLRTRMRVGEAQDRVRFRENVLLERLAAEGVTDPDVIEERLAEDASLSDLRGLLDSRKEQQEDMVALGIFFLFLSAADAYVSAHLSRFPEPLDVSARSSPAGPVMEFQVRLPLRP